MVGGNQLRRPRDIDMEGTIVVPTEQLLVAGTSQDETWDNLQASRPERFESPAEPKQILK